MGAHAGGPVAGVLRAIDPRAINDSSWALV
jgi:hypothetical protein